MLGFRVVRNRPIVGRSSVASELAQLAVAQLQWGPVVVDHLAVLERLVQRIVTGTVLAGVVATHLTEQLQLPLAHLDGFLEQNPGDRLRARRSGQRAVVGPVGLGLRQEIGRIHWLVDGNLGEEKRVEILLNTVLK